jgi:hypothetical protein
MSRTDAEVIGAYGGNVIEVKVVDDEENDVLDLNGNLVTTLQATSASTDVYWLVTLTDGNGN